MKNLLVFCLLLLTSLSFAQENTVIGQDVQLRKVSVGQRQIPDSSGNLHYFLAVSFLTEAESGPPQFKYFLLSSKQELNAAIKTLKEAVEVAERKGSESWDNGKYEIVVEKKGKAILLFTTLNGRGFTRLKKDDAENFIKYLEGVKLWD